MVGPLFYAMEGNYVARWGTAGLDPVQAIFAASVRGAWSSCCRSCWPRASGSTRSRPFGAPEAALVASSVVNTLMYVGYNWLARAAGAVFAAQVGYVVTIAGVGWRWRCWASASPMLIWVAVALLLVA